MGKRSPNNVSSLKATTVVSCRERARHPHESVSAGLFIRL